MNLKRPIMKTLQPTYRLLRKDELKNLEQDFVYFLSSQGVDADAWKAIKEGDELAAVKYLALFSDFIFDNVLGRTEFLIHFTKQAAHVFHCLSNKIIRIEITSELPTLDLSALNLFDTASYKKENRLNLKMFEKTIDENNRKKQLFELMENGCLISDGQLYKLVCLMMAENETSETRT